MTAVQRHEEFETKLSADERFRLPDLSGVGAVVSVRRMPVQQLVADYYDTDDLRLIRRRITLRRRSGGTDDGWHVKLPAGDDDRRRQEIHVPLRTPGLPPVRLVDLLLGQTRGSALGHVATVRNRRVPFRLLDDAGEVLAELTDDHVTVEGDATADRFRELEIEAAPGVEPELLTPVVDALIAAGATASSMASKAARALGPRALEPYDVGPTPGTRSSASDTVRARVDLVPAVSALLDADLVVRLGDDDGTLLRQALGRVLAAVRDHAGTIGVARVRVLVSECAGLAELLGDRSAGGRDDLLQAMHRGRYLTLLDTLVDLARDPVGPSDRAGRTVRGTDQGGTR